MKNAHWKMLEELFSADCAGNIFQTKSTKVIEHLEKEGYAQRIIGQMGGGALNITIKGWAITQRGHIEYCKWISEQPDRPKTKITGQPKG